MLLDRSRDSSVCYLLLSDSLHVYVVWYFLHSLEQNIHHRLIAEIQGILGNLVQSSKDECICVIFISELVITTLLQTLFKSFELIFQADPSLLISAYDNDLINLLSSCFHNLEGSLITHSLIESMLSFTKILVLYDRSPDKAIIKEFLLHILFDSIIWERIPPQTAIWFHDQLYTTFSIPYISQILTSTISLPVTITLKYHYKVYLSCVVSANICFVDTLTPMLYLYLSNAESLTAKNEIYRAVYNHMTEMILLNPCPLIQIS